jgi:DNA-binding transcriptional regulator YdaS (Cro superfamily)
MVDEPNTQLIALERAVAACGGQAPLARKIGVKQAHIWNWLNKSLRAPAEYAIAIENATDRMVTRHELRPDIYPSEEQRAAS